MNNLPEFADMMLFAAVVEEGSFTAAAERLGRTKSAVSQGVSRLEADLGLKLMIRSTRRLSLTREGETFLAHCQTIARLRQDAVAEACAGSDSPTGHLTLTAPTALSATLITPVLSRFLARYPDVTAEVIGTDSHLDLAAQQIDLAIRVGTPQEQAARQRLLGHMRDILCASPELLRAHGGLPASPEEIADWDYVASGWQGARPMLQLPDGRTLPVRTRIRCSNLSDTLQFIRQGMGIGLLPDFAIRQDIAEGRLVALLEDAPAPSQGIYALHLYDRHPPQRVRRFTDLLKQELLA